VDPVGVLDHDHVLALDAGQAEFGDRLGAMVEQTLLVGGVEPGAGHHPGAVARADLVLVGLDDLVDRRRVDELLLGEQRFERLDAQLDVGQGAIVAMIAHWRPPSVINRQTLADAFPLDQSARAAACRKLRVG
jgi:hypothetical protein